jgi:hypothetical protein
MDKDQITWQQVLDGLKNEHIDWLAFFDERQRKEIAFDVVYAKNFAHGTDGHNARLIIARFSELMDLLHDHIRIQVTGDEPPA